MRVRRTTVAVACALACAGCGSSPTANPDGGLAPDEIPLVVDQRCPGDPGCPDTGDGKLYAGAARRNVTPTVEPFVDVNGDGYFEPGEPFTDLDGNGKFDPVWLGGRNTGRLALGVHDPVWMRCYALRQNATTIAHCAIDAVGYFQDEARQIRADLDPALGVDLVMMSATHDHQSVDTLGIWGPDDSTTGYDPAIMKRFRLAAVSAITEAVGNLRPAKLSLGSIVTADGDDMTHYVSDTRDPCVIDNRLHLIQLDGEDGKPIVSVVNWAAHPDSLGSHGRFVSSDWVHYFREAFEAKTGSPVVYINGAEGGQIGPGRITPVDVDGNTLPNERSYRFIDAWGNEVAKLALEAYQNRAPVDAPKLSFRHTTFGVHIENVGYHTAFLLGILHKQVYGFDRTKPLIRDASGDNTPIASTEVAYLQLGPARILTAPGELLPEFLVGGYNGEHKGTYPLFDPLAVPLYDPSKAPKGPYLYDLMDGDPEHRMLFGLTFDMLGYIIPVFNFYLDPDAPYIDEPPGSRDNHYEETNSIGPRADPEIVGTMRQLILSH